MLLARIEWLVEILGYLFLVFELRGRLVEEEGKEGRGRGRRRTGIRLLLPVVFVSMVRRGG